MKEREDCSKVKQYYHVPYFKLKNGAVLSRM